MCVKCTNSMGDFHRIPGLVIPGQRSPLAICNQIINRVAEARESVNKGKEAVEKGKEKARESVAAAEKKKPAGL